MIKKGLHTVFVIAMLSLLLVGKVGIHLFHHHETVKPSASITAGVPQLTVEVEDQECTLCALDLFLDVFLVGSLTIVFVSLFYKSFVQFFSKEFLSRIHFSSSRGPPVLSL